MYKFGNWNCCGCDSDEITKFMLRNKADELSFKTPRLRCNPCYIIPKVLRFTVIPTFRF